MVRQCYGADGVSETLTKLLGTEGQAMQLNRGVTLGLTATVAAYATIMSATGGDTQAMGKLDIDKL